jgi:hypothetical protein
MHGATKFTLYIHCLSCSFVMVLRLHLGQQGTWVSFTVRAAIFVFIEFRSSGEGKAAEA